MSVEEMQMIEEHMELQRKLSTDLAKALQHVMSMLPDGPGSVTRGLMEHLKERADRALEPYKKFMT